MLIEHLIDIGEAEAADGSQPPGDLDGFYKEARGQVRLERGVPRSCTERVVMLQAGDPETLRLWKMLVDLRHGSL